VEHPLRVVLEARGRQIPGYLQVVSSNALLREPREEVRVQRAPQLDRRVIVCAAVAQRPEHV
jgi:hypothetical protein